ncbi:MAG TPA: sugar ABC transporter ATP-binding protein [Chthoniobacterales bacterium]
MKALRGVDLDIYAGEIHALVGENGAGKSTLMKILAGVQTPDGGEILLDEKPVHFHSPHQARAHGIGIIYQELSVAPNLTVAENVFLGTEVRRLGFLTDRRTMVRRTQEVLDRLGARFRANQIASHLSIAEQQQVEIARALFHKSRILVMDEPTTALSDRETDRLFEVVRQLRADGISIIYISHRMAENYDLSDRLTVFRDGGYVGEITRDEFDSDRVIEMMVGRKLDDFYKGAETNPGDVALEVRNVGDGDRIKGASFQVRKGEVLGLAGLVGAGRTELARLIFGADKKKTGEVWLYGNQLKINNPSDAIQAGIAYVPEDRKLQGLFLQMSCRDNISMNVVGEKSMGGVVNFSDINDRSRSRVQALRVRTSSLRARANGLSGGNQQKLLLARWLEISPKVLILDEPTRGVDIGSKVEIYGLIQQMAQKGLAVIFISSELPEIIGICKRILVMHEGEITGEVGGDSGIEITQTNIMKLATGNVVV